MANEKKEAVKVEVSEVIGALNSLQYHVNLLGDNSNALISKLQPFLLPAEEMGYSGGNSRQTDNKVLGKIWAETDRVMNICFQINDTLKRLDL